MKIPKFAKALVLSTAIFAMATPVFAAPTPVVISNTLTATFKINPVAPGFVLEWIDSIGGATVTNPLAEIEANAGDESELFMRATVAEQTFYMVMFKVTRTDGVPISEEDVAIYDYSVEPASERDGTLMDDGTAVYFWSRTQSVTDTEDLKFGIQYNVDGNFKVEAVAVDAPV